MPAAKTRPIAALCASVLAGVCVLGGAGCGASGSPGSTAGLSLASARRVAPARSSASPAPFRFFAASGLWNAELGASAADPGSTEDVRAFADLIAAERRAGNGPWVNTTSYSYPVYTVTASQATVAVKLVGPAATNTALAAAWRSVPLPPAARPAVGTDGSLVVWQPSTERLWEFHRLVHKSTGWQAEWGGAMRDVASDPGVYGSGAWPGAQSWWGASASSLSVPGGLISLEDLRLGRIDHALAMAVPNVRAGVYSLPAQRTDGASRGPTALPEGAHLRLDPRLDLASLHLPHFVQLLAEAAQRYGIYVTDWSPVVELYAQDPTPTGSNPYAGASGYFEGKRPSQLLAAFPWARLELLPLQLRSGHASSLQRLLTLRRELRARGYERRPLG